MSEHEPIRGNVKINKSLAGWKAGAAAAAVAGLEIISSACGSSPKNGLCPKQPLSDVNGDRVVDSKDAAQIYGSDVLSICPVFSEVVQDRNAGLIDKNDLAAVKGALGTSPENPKNSKGLPVYNPIYDVNKSGGPINQKDVDIVQNNFGIIPKGAFGLEKPQEIINGYISQTLTIGAGSGLSGKNLSAEDSASFTYDWVELLEGSGFQVLSTRFLKGPDGSIPKVIKAPLVITVSTSRLENPDDLDHWIKELVSEHNLVYVEKIPAGSAALD